MSKVDLHLHSNFSDGSDSPEELLRILQKNNIKIFALTDHDTQEACGMLSSIVPCDMKFIPSIELTCTADDIKCHILGYNCDYNNKVLADLIAKGKILRRKKLETRIKFLKNVWNIDLTKDELNWLFSRKSVVKTHLGNILVNRGLAADNVSAMKNYLDGCKTENSRFSADEAIAAIVSSGGIPVWAHPLGGEGEVHDSKSVFEKKLIKMISFGIRGLECYYSRYDNVEIQMLLEAAKRKDLYVSGGSDYHGSNKDGIQLAQLNIENNFVDSNFLSVLTIM